MDTIKEESIKQMLDLFFKYYMSSDSKIFKVMDELLEYKDEVVNWFKSQGQISDSSC